VTLGIKGLGEQRQKVISHREIDTRLPLALGLVSLSARLGCRPRVKERIQQAVPSLPLSETSHEVIVLGAASSARPVLYWRVRATR